MMRWLPKPPTCVLFGCAVLWLFSCVLDVPVFAAITDSLVAHWKLEENTGTRVDEHDDNDLTDNSSVPSGTGKLSNGADCELGSTDSMEIADNTDLSMGDIDFTIAFWVKLESEGTYQTLVAKWQTTGDSREYLVDYLNSTDRFRVTISATGTSTQVTQAADSLGGVTGDGTVWYFIIAQYDATNNVVGIQGNDGTLDTEAQTGGAFDGTADFNLCAQANTPANFADGVIDSVSIWKRLLTAGEKTSLYNGGSGLEYPFASSVVPRGSLLGILP